MFNIATTNTAANYLFRAMSASEFVMNVVDNSTIIHNHRRIVSPSVYGRTALIAVQSFSAFCCLLSGTIPLLFRHYSYIPRETAISLCITGLQLSAHSVGNLCRLLIAINPITKRYQQPSDSQVFFWKCVKGMALAYDAYSLHNGARPFGNYPGGWFKV